jgi:hypothetical protein
LEKLRLSLWETLYQLKRLLLWGPFTNWEVRSFWETLYSEWETLAILHQTERPGTIFCLPVSIFRVLYFSLHRYDNAMFFPGAADANFDYVGGGEGAGFNINVAWNGRAKGDMDYLLAFYHILMPVALEVRSRGCAY